jgi:hypothetical protein
MANISLDLSTICAQRKKRATLINNMGLFKNRYELPNPYVDALGNPYRDPLGNKYTQGRFNMRRKAEILKYNNNSSQSNPKLTRSLKWSRLVNSSSKEVASYNDTILYQNDGSGNYTTIIVKFPNKYAVSQQVIGFDIFENPIYMDVYTIIPGNLPAPCPTNIIRPSIYSGVPGPSVNLFLDENVPLVYYNKNVNAYGIINTKTTSLWNAITKNNIFFSDSINKLFMNLAINNTIDKFAYSFSMKIPVSIYFTAKVVSGISPRRLYLQDNQISIENINIFTFFDGKQINYQTQPVWTLDHPETIDFNISMDIVDNSVPIYDNNGIVINNSLMNNTITIQYYLGMLNVSNLYLLTAPSYIYDIELNFRMHVTLNSLFSSYFDSPTFGVYCNVNSNYSERIAENVILQNNSTYQLDQFQFTGA